MDRALCAYIDDPDRFFPGRGQSRRTTETKKICFECPVRKDCGDYQKKTGTTDGIWGGETVSRKKT